jgi:hypothetical protein
MNIAQLSLKSLIFELRYPNAYRLWDTAGSIWASAMHRWPALTLREAAPNQQRFSLENRAELSIHLDRAFVRTAGSKLTLDDLIPYCRFIADDALPLLEISTFTRVGFKPTFVKEYQSMDDAVKDFFSTGMVKQIVGKNFGIDGKSDSPTVTMRFEGEYLGCMTTLLARRRMTRLEVQTIGDEDFEPATKEHLELVYECDYFTKGDMTSGQLKASEWIEDAMHVIRRDSHVILGG